MAIVPAKQSLCHLCPSFDVGSSYFTSLIVHVHDRTCTHVTIIDVWKDCCIVVHWYNILSIYFVCTNKQCIYMVRHLTTTYMFEVFWSSSSCHCHMWGLESRRETTRVKKNAMTKGCLYSGNIYAGGVGKDTGFPCLFWWFLGWLRYETWAVLATRWFQLQRKKTGSSQTAGSQGSNLTVRLAKFQENWYTLVKPTSGMEMSLYI